MRRNSSSVWLYHLVQAMQPDLAAQQIDTIDARLHREGWSLHQRLEAAITSGEVPQSGAAIQSWCQIVAPDNDANFDKRLAWDGLSAASAAVTAPTAVPPRTSSRKRSVVNAASTRAREHSDKRLRSQNASTPAAAPA